MFLGEYKVKFTGQGRIVLPRKFRNGIEGEKTVVLSRGMDGCIWGFSKSDWEEEVKKQLEVPVTEKAGRDLRRYLFSAAEMVMVDEQGRFVIPGVLLEYAELKDEAVVIGAGDHFEVWAPSVWKSLLKEITSVDGMKKDKNENV